MLSKFAITDDELLEIITVLGSNGVFGSTEIRKRLRLSPIELHDTVWGRMLRDPRLQDPDSFENKKFRRRFRIPYRLFVDVLVPLCAQRDVFRVKSNSTIPLEFRLLIALRILGRGCTADDCFELSGVGESTCNTISLL